MSTKRDSELSPKSWILSRRRVLEGLGAIAATACGGTETGIMGTGGSGNTPASGGGGFGSGVTGGSGPAASGGSSAGTSPAATGGSAGAHSEGSPQGGGGTTGGTAQGGVATGGGSAGAGGAGSSTPLVSPPWDGVPEYCMASPATCQSPTDGAGQGPFFIHDAEKPDDVSLNRQDIRGRYNMDADPGVEMQLHVRLLTSTGSSCGEASEMPLADTEVYIWHTDAQGYYSGFGTRGMPDEQKPDTAYAGKPGPNDLDVPDRFCRGLQTTDANGVVSYRSIFPGWYNGRVLHIHLIAFKKGSTSLGRTPDYSKSSSPMWLYTTQFYFDKDFVRSVHEKYAPYKARTSLPDYTKSINSGTISDIAKSGAGQNCLGSAMRTESTSSGLIAKASIMNDIVTAQINVLLKG